MRILLLADINSAHTIKWAKAMAARGIETGIFSLSRAQSDWFKEMPAIHYFPGMNLSPAFFYRNSLFKLAYLFSIFKLKNVIRRFKPGLVHAHYASSYGFIGTISGFHPLLVSVWGSDVMEFPEKNPIHRSLIKKVLSSCDRILLTSVALKNTVSEITGNVSEIINFGVDTALFSPSKTSSRKKENSITLGIVKSLEKIYGIDVLISAFSQLIKRQPGMIWELILVGGGSLETEYKKKVDELGLTAQVTFTGRINQEEVIRHLQKMDIFVNPSRNESFGVSVLEASSCGIPVIASRVGGLPEVVREGETGFLTEPGSPEAITEAVEKLIKNPLLREQMGKNGRSFVENNYNWSANAEQMVNVYKSLLKP